VVEDNRGGDKSVVAHGPSYVVLEKKWIDKLTAFLEITEQMESFLVDATGTEQCISIKQIAKILSCSERTVRRRIKKDDRFPNPIRRTRYEDGGRMRTMHPRWNTADIRRYKSLISPSCK